MAQRLQKKVMIWLMGWVRKMVDHSKVHFITSNPVDKILYESPTTSGSYTGGGPAAPITHNFSIPHTLGVPVIANGMFSNNGSDFYPCGASIPGSPVPGNIEFLQCDMYADANNVYVYIDNGFTTTQTVYIYYALESLS
jgi:hypothetical protein